MDMIEVISHVTVNRENWRARQYEVPRDWKNSLRILRVHFPRESVIWLKIPTLTRRLKVKEKLSGRDVVIKSHNEIVCPATEIIGIHNPCAWLDPLRLHSSPPLIRFHFLCCIVSEMAASAMTSSPSLGQLKVSIDKASNFMRQFRDPTSRELKKLTASQFLDVWSHYDKDGKWKCTHAQRQSSRRK